MVTLENVIESVEGWAGSIGTAIGRYVSAPDRDIENFSPGKAASRGRGFTYKGSEFIHHTELGYAESAFFRVLPAQKIVAAVVGVALAAGLLVNWHGTILVVLCALVIFYFADSALNAFLIYRSFSRNPEIKIEAGEIAARDDSFWPTYTVFCPLYREWQVVPQFVRAISAIDYPADRMQVMLLLEEDDAETIEKIRLQELPENFEVVVVPHSKPKTKPKAMNYGLKFARGEYLVIYDAEDVPDTDQMKKAVLAYEKAPPNTVCIQAKLNFYNPHQNLLTRVFTAEYSLWFDLVLTGLQSIGAPIPLGGTSNHFKTEKLRELHGWDAFNVTEDCDLGLRIASHGYRTAIVDSTTLEEANSNLGNWYRQRSRWIKGYMQTYLVHMRDPGSFIENGRASDLAMVQLTVGGKIVSMFVNPAMWALTIAYFLFRAHIGTFVESFFPLPILYIGVVSLVFGNFLYLYYYMVGCAKHGQFALMRYAFLVPLYWLAMSAAAWQALYEMAVRPHYWAKTVHGLHISGNSVSGGKPARVAEEEPQPVPEPMAPPYAHPHAQAEAQPAASRWGFGAFGAGAFLIAATLATNALNFLFNALLGRFLTLQDFATVTLFGTVWNILAVALGALSGAVTYRVAYLGGQGRSAAGARFFRTVEKSTWIIAGALSVAWAVSVPLFSKFFNVSSQLLVLSFTPAIVLGSLAAIQNGYLRGKFSFVLLGQSLVYEAFSKTAIALLFVYAGFHWWASLAIPASIAISFVGSWLFVRSLRDNWVEAPGSPVQAEAEAFPASYFGASVVYGLATTIFLNVDVLLAKHYFDPATAGAYALLSLVGKVVYFVGTLLLPFVASVVSRHEGAGTDGRADFYKLLSGTALGSFTAFATVSVFGWYVVPALFGARSIAIVPYVAPYCLAMALFSVSTSIISYHLIRKQNSFAWIMLASVCALVVGIVFSHGSIANFTAAMEYTGILSAAAILSWHVVLEHSGHIADGAATLARRVLGVDAGPQPAAPTMGGRRILMFNWRDTKHVFAGGAEVYIYELARRWVQDGNQVTLFCGNDGHQDQVDVVEGIHIVRRGGFYLVYLWALVYYVLEFRGKFDVIVDCHNGIPFFTPMFTREKVYCLMHHVHQDVFRRSLVPPFSWFAEFLENTAMPFVYRKTKFITVSKSSKADMLDLGLGRMGLAVVNPGVDLENLEPGVRHRTPLVLYLGRLKEYKSVDVLIRAFAQVVSKLPSAKLVIAGDGEERSKLEHLAADLGIDSSVTFTGKVTEQQKISLLKRAWVFCNPSMMEGWGITTIEANACGVPVVASDVPGLRDSVRNPSTGYLVEHGNVDGFAEKIHRILTDRDLRATMRVKCLLWASNFDWAKSAAASLAVITEAGAVSPAEL